MKLYVFSLSGENSGYLPSKYAAGLKKEECFYRKQIPLKYVNKPTEGGWPADYCDDLPTGRDVVRKKHVNYHGAETEWIEWDSIGVRFYTDSFDLINNFGGQVCIHSQGRENSSSLFQECETFLGLPELEPEDMIAEIIDDGLESELYEFREKLN